MSDKYNTPSQEEIDRLFDRMEHNDKQAYNIFIEKTQESGKNIISSIFKSFCTDLNNKYDIEDTMIMAQQDIFLSIRKREYLEKCYDHKYYFYYLSFYKYKAYEYLHKQFQRKDIALTADILVDIRPKEDDTTTVLFDEEKENIYDLWKIILQKLMEENSAPHHVIFYAYAKVLPLVEDTLTNSQNINWGINRMNNRTVFVLSDEFEELYNAAPLVPIVFRWGTHYRKKLSVPYTAYGYNFPVTGEIVLLGTFDRNNLYNWYATIDKNILIKTHKEARKTDLELFEFLIICSRDRQRREAQKCFSKSSNERSSSNEN